MKDWKQLELLTAEQWLLKLCGREVYRIVWQPLLRGKFGAYASEVSAVWFWNKLVLRGGSRGRGGKEVLGYYRGGFSALAERIVDKIRSCGGEVLTGAGAEALIIENSCIKAVQTTNDVIDCGAVIATPALPIIADLLEGHLSSGYVGELRKIKYLASLCLVLELSDSLSDIYWLNVCEEDFPFVGLIEHTNFQKLDSVADRHIVYLSKYLRSDCGLYNMDKEDVLELSLPYIDRIFPKFDRSWLMNYHVWKARYAQPVVVRHYSKIIPPNETPLEGFYISTMAQIYPEDRGTNYAVRQGRSVGRMVANRMMAKA